ncbi:SdpI family protein [Undibacterium terreum]|uniref:SdpI/YhfL protein family protein n=1 Tax=Undibacterium terreum TaxID=1224302 RepID=A0A916XDD0_9BURK|nr:SdpI family protein [Undibacterium terreum]GGC63427.1 hypothetical protein GCM10011396_07970 [Undibacterium terreum]
MLTAIFGLYLSLPLWLGEVAPNTVTGFRTAKTMSDPKIWYAVNSVVGRDMVIVNLVLALLALIFHFTFGKSKPSISALGLTAWLAIGSGAVAIYGRQIS